MRGFTASNGALCSGPPRLNARDGHFLAGFVDAEGCFQMHPVNGAASWRCEFSLALRDDDSELLVELRELTGLGNLLKIPAKRTSKPQVLWSVQSRPECLYLAALLEKFPLRGRKRHEFAVWSEALRVIDDGRDRVVLPQLADRLRSLKRYVNPPTTPTSAPRLDDDLLAYIGGFFTGEGHLALTTTRARAAVRLRDDDRPLLEHLATATGVGKLYSSPQAGRTRPAVCWAIFRHDHLAFTADLLERAGVRGRKAKELPAWQAAVRELASAQAERRRPRAEFLAARRTELLEARRYRPGPAFDTPSRRERLRARYVHALRTAATTVTGPLTVTAYEALRQPNPLWPSRNTITRAFGGWSEALVAAGLTERRGPRRYACGEPEQYTLRELGERHAQLRRVTDLVAQLTAIHGGPPTVHQYLAWRIANDKSLPCLAKLYDLFPGGWSSVTKQATAMRAA